MSRSQRIATDVWASLLANRQRALLMMLGLIVGVAVLSSVIVIGQGTRSEVMALVERHGLDNIMVRAGGDVQVFAPQADRGLASLMEGDALAISAEVPYVQRVSGVQNARGISVVYEDRSVVTRGFGVGPDWLEIRRWNLAEGEFISESDMAAMSRVVILGLKVAEALFPEGGAVGRTVRVNNDPYVVKGVFGYMGTDAAGLDDWDDRIVVPLATSARRLFNRPYLEQIMIRADNLERVPEVAERVRELLVVRHNIAPGQPHDFFVREPEDVQGAALETSTTLTALLVAISVIALVAGGLVIMNLMLMAVAQRSPEIGLRRALGARTSDISRQFLFESLFLSVAGGTIGVVVGVVTALVLELSGLASSRVTWVPFVAALGMCVVIGLAFGVYPARKAAGVDPATSLRGRAA
jgi:putative ABC transport system permease protein